MKIGGVVAVGSTRARNSKKPSCPSCEKKPGNAFTLTVASHYVAATREVDPRHSTRDLRLEQRPPKNSASLRLCVKKLPSNASSKTFVPFVPSCEKKPGNAFTLTVASHCVAATREVDPRHSTRDLRRSQHPQKSLRLYASALNKPEQRHLPKNLCPSVLVICG